MNKLLVAIFVIGAAGCGDDSSGSGGGALGCGDPDLDPSECQVIEGAEYEMEGLAFLDCVTEATTVENCRCFKGETAGAGGAAGSGGMGDSGPYLDCNDDCSATLEEYADCLE